MNKCKCGKIILNKSKYCQRCFIKLHNSHKYEHLAWNWKGGKPKCQSCSKEIKGWEAKLCRDCFKESMKGKKNTNYGKCGKQNSNWHGGISKLPYPFEFNHKLKTIVRKRDNYICQICGCRQSKYKTRLTIHHIDYNKQNCELNNLISLCWKCHLKTNFDRLSWMIYFVCKEVCHRDTLL